MTSLIQRTYQSASGETVTSSEETVNAVRHALGVNDTDAWEVLLEPVVIAWGGKLDEITIRIKASDAARRIGYEVELESGDVVEGNIPASCRRQRKEKSTGRSRKLELVCRTDLTLPIGYHTLRVHTASGDAEALVLAAPRACYSGDRAREWGIFAPVYALRSKKSQIIGDFGDLQALMEWTGQMGGGIVGTLPISATFLREPVDPSPYSPASRLYWNELFLRTREKLISRKTGQFVDYRAAADAKRELLELVAYGFFHENLQKEKPFKEFLALYPDAREYAQFRAACEAQKKGWVAWPARMRDGRLRTSDYDVDAANYHLYAQFAVHQQLKALSANSSVRLYLDMPLGVHPDSYDVWRHRDLFITGASAGAPPDPFFTKGQSWGFPPMHPVRMREDRYRYWRRVIQTQLRYASILRLDHVMALHRLYIVPQGCDATDGAYVRYPSDELYAVLTIESNRHAAILIGEDLGTVPPEVRTAMAKHGVKRMFVVQFEASEGEPPIGEIPDQAVASLNTHDMPTFKSYWEGDDADLRQELGLIDVEGVKEAKDSRKLITKQLSKYLGSKSRLSTPHALRSTLKHLAQSSADMVLLNLEDLWLEELPQNVPGTSVERPNWRRRLRYTIDEIKKDSLVQETVQMVACERGSDNA